MPLIVRPASSSLFSRALILML